jgi:hypothetical protein
VWIAEPDPARMTLKVPELPVEEWHHFKKTAGVLKATVPIDRRFSLYATIGDVMPITCWAILLGGGGWVLVKRHLQSRKR